MAYELSTLDPAFGGATRITCIDPNAPIKDDESTFSKMFSSHKWKIEYSKPHGSGVYIAFSCQRCGAVGHAIIENR